MLALPFLVRGGLTNLTIPLMERSLTEWSCSQNMLSHTRHFMLVFYVCDIIGYSGCKFSSRAYPLLTTLLTFYQVNKVLASAIDVLPDFILLFSSFTSKISCLFHNITVVYTRFAFSPSNTFAT